ncbi:HNH endonuclease [Actinacidiphila sp. ITFR-21]|uniref:HNH endonuclease n=1 Tax=Actinacidiphila sp. ITFR-21 TaxID=3075199 RepID=UPI0028896669|nr:HNH endonuclease [Streptomyces sp. ITFR-21]WNI19223.1 HNH endonuclease [Streptomyces sp. ITFR-21]
MASSEKHARWCAGQLATHLTDKICDMCKGSEDLALVFKKRWWAEVAITSWAQTKSNLTTTLSRTRITCRPCIENRMSEIRVVLESGLVYEICQDDDCVKPVASRGFCVNHRYSYMRAAGVKPRSMAPAGTGQITKEGYRRISAPGHPNVNRHGRILEHRKVLADRLGRPLQPGENAHHKNGNRLDNRSENLELRVTSQPSGQRAADLVVWANEILEKYADDVERGLT